MQNNNVILNQRISPISSMENKYNSHRSIPLFILLVALILIKLSLGF